jgi:hypothetical protein
MECFKRYHLLLCLLLPPLFSACATTPKICTESGAFQSGRARAIAGLAPDWGAGAACEAEQAAVFRSHYEQGYQVGYSSLCQADAVRDKGFRSGRDGIPEKDLPSVYAICQKELEALKAIYAESYGKGLDAFCDTSAATDRGAQDGRRGVPSQFRSDSVAVCGTRMAAYQAAYQNAYAEELRDFCSAKQIEEAAYQQGRAYQNQLNIRDAFASCSEVERGLVQSRYQQSYLRGLREYCLPQNHAEMRNSWLPTEEDPTYSISRYESCVRNFPDLWNQYKDIYRRERAQYVENNCTFAAGQQAGKLAAYEYNAYEAQVPKFCNAGHLPSYQRGFDIGWREVKNILCSPADLEERGYQDAQRGLQASAPVPASCPVDMRLRLSNSYQSGYTRGLQQAELSYQQNPSPTQVDPSYPNRPVHRPPHKRQCRTIYPVRGPLPSQILMSGVRGEMLYPNNMPFMNTDASGAQNLYYPDQRPMLRLNADKDQLTLYWPNGTQLRYPQRRPQGRTLFLPDNVLWYLEVNDPADQRLNAAPFQSFQDNQSTVTYQWDNQGRDVFKAELSLSQGLLRVEFLAATNRLTVLECPR